MPETEADTVTREWLQGQLRAATENVIVLDCRSTNEFQDGHIRPAVNFSIPSIMLRRLAAGKIDLTSTIMCKDLKQRIKDAYNDCVFVLYAAESTHTNAGAADAAATTTTATMMGGNGGGAADATINVLHRRLKQDGCRVYLLQDGFASFRDAFPEWCEDDSAITNSKSTLGGPNEQLMGLGSLRISTPHSDSTCSSSNESSDCESNSHPQIAEAPVEILPGLFLGNERHSADARALQRYNIKYVLNVTPNLPNVFEKPGDIRYLKIPIMDHWSQDLASYFPTAISFIEEARTSGCSVLIHCLAGVSRSVTVTLAYIMHSRAYSLNDAFSLVRQRKHDVSPNFHFMEQLHSFEIQLLKANPTRTPLSAVSSDSSSGSYLTPDCSSSADILPSVPYSAYGVRPSKYSCACLEVECKCIMMSGGSVRELSRSAGGGGIGVSPDSGIEFDRWTPASDVTPK